MGQKIHPTGFRLGTTKYWISKWYSESNYAEWLQEDLAIRANLVKHLEAKPHGESSISLIKIERLAPNIKITIHTSKPGTVIGKRGQGIEDLKNYLQRFTKSNIFLKVQEVRKPDMDASLVAQGIARKLERRVSFRRAMKSSVQTAMKLGAEGIRIACSGRLGGAEMSRREQYREGRVPLHTIRADIDYGFAEAKTQYGIIGVKVWIFKGEVLDELFY